jgi:hypothetical protein
MLVQFSRVGLALSLFATSSVAVPQEMPFVGKLHGVGRECGGLFSVGKKTLTWDTPFNRCVQVPYSIIKQEKQGEHLLVLYQLKSPGKKCYSPFIVLEHEPDNAEKNPGWGASGYKSEEAWKKDYTDSVVSCNLWPVQ